MSEETHTHAIYVQISRVVKIEWEDESPDIQTAIENAKGDSELYELFPPPGEGADAWWDVIDFEDSWIYRHE